jgi:hypothetical protein
MLATAIVSGAWTIVTKSQQARAGLRAVANEEPACMAKAPLWDINSGAEWSPGETRGHESAVERAGRPIARVERLLQSRRDMVTAASDAVGACMRRPLA